MKKIFSLIFVVLIIVLTFNGCKTDPTTDENAPRSLVIVIQNTANTAAPMLTSSEVKSLILDAAVHDGSSITLIEADGNAYTVDSLQIKVNSKVSDAKRAALANSVVDKTIEIAKTATPKTEEVDPLKALHAAARNVDKNATVKTVVYLGSSLQTGGILSFAKNNYFNADIEKTTQYLKNNSAIPDFPEGTRVVFAGVGDVALPQEDLTYKNVASLKALWKRVCEEGGANVEFITATPVDVTDPASFPSVTPVAIFHDEVPVSVETATDDIFAFSQEKIAFLPDSYELADPEATTEYLKPIAQLIINSGRSILICGTTATVGSNSNCVIFSEKRAKTIASVLINLGVREDRIITKGLGFENNFHVPDLNSDNTLNETEAAKNRLVIIMPLDSRDAQNILGN